MTADPDTGRVMTLRPPHHRIERRAVLWWVLQSLMLWVPIITGVAIGCAIWEAGRPWLVVVLVGAILAALAGTVVEPWWRYAVHRWETTDEAVYGLSGWLVREWRVAPISRIQTVDAVRGPLEQMLGLSTLRITTASSKGAIDIAGLDRDVAAEAAERLAAIAQITPGDAT